MLRRLFASRRREDAAFALYHAAVVQARLPDFYERFAVADTLDGRFDLLALHVHLVLRRLGVVEGARAEEARALSQAVFDLMFADMDQNLREMGVGDLSVGKKVKAMAEAFYGRVAAYDKALAEQAGLAEALGRNLYRGTEPAAEAVAAMAAHVARQDAHMSAQAEDEVLAGRVSFLAPGG